MAAPSGLTRFTAPLCVGPLSFPRRGHYVLRLLASGACPKGRVRASPASGAPVRDALPSFAPSPFYCTGKPRDVRRTRDHRMVQSASALHGRGTPNPVPDRLVATTRRCADRYHDKRAMPMP